jgi:2',3'-cyclic-nucleotide 2'-phosphodiesterase (5'-nucleotidase family)
MVRRRWWAAAILLLIVAAALTYKAPTTGETFTLFFTATVHGNVEPCGCPVNPSGGIARRAWHIRHRATPGDAVVLLDGGDVVGPPTKKGLLQTECLFRGMEQMGYTLVGLGARDFSFGLDFLRAAQRQHGFTFTSANLARRDGNLVFLPYCVMRVGRGRVLGISFGGQKVGVISVMGSDLQPVCPTCDPPLDLLDPLESVQRSVSAIRQNVDLVVVLAYTDQEQIERMLSIPAVDIVVAARTLYPPSGYDNAGMRGHVALAYTAYEGRRIGQMRIQRAADGRIASAEGDLHSLGETVSEDPDLADLVARYKAESALLPPEPDEGSR